LNERSKVIYVKSYRVCIIIYEFYLYIKRVCKIIPCI